MLPDVWSWLRQPFGRADRQSINLLKKILKLFDFHHLQTHVAEINREALRDRGV
jgi:hypothetical protein